MRHTKPLQRYRKSRVLYHPTFLTHHVTLKNAVAVVLKTNSRVFSHSYESLPDNGCPEGFVHKQICKRFSALSGLAISSVQPTYR